jgi:ABC-2 type transport system permease protein
MTAEAITIERAETRRAQSGRPGVGAVYRWELRKLVAQKRTFLGIGAAFTVPLVFIVALLADSGGGGPEGVPFGEYVRQSGLAIPLVCLFFGAIWLLPLITALVAGDIVAAEDHNGTLKTILTRSVERWHVFAGKALAAFTYTVVLLAIYVGVGIVVGGLVYGFDPLTTLSGTTIGPGRADLDRGGHARLRAPADGDGVDRAAAVGRDAQLRRGGRRHADGLDRVPDPRLDLRA